jgi:hypothetical protein
VGLILAAIFALPLVVSRLFPSAGSTTNDLALVTLLFTSAIAPVFLAMPCAPVLLLERGWVGGRAKLESKPGPIAEL